MNSSGTLSLSRVFAHFMYEIKLNYDRDSTRGLPVLYFIFFFAPETSSEVPNADKTSDFFTGKIYTTRFPSGVLGSFLSFPLFHEKLLLIPSAVSRFAISKRFSRWRACHCLEARVGSFVKFRCSNMLPAKNMYAASGRSFGYPAHCHNEPPRYTPFPSPRHRHWHVIPDRA